MEENPVQGNGDQRTLALQRANQIRRDIAEVRAEISGLPADAGRQRAAELLASRDPRVHSLRISLLLKSIHKLGEGSIRGLLDEQGLHHGDRIGDLEPAKRETMAARLSAEGWRRPKIAAGKQCSKCRQIKPYSHFRRNGRQCHTCRLGYQAEWDEQHRQRTRERKRLAYEREMADPERAERRRERNREAMRKYRANNPERVKDAVLRYRERLRKDPERYQKRLETGRLNYALRKYRDTGEWPRRRGKYNGGKDRRVPIHELREWVNRKLDQYGTQGTLAKACRVDPKIIWRIENLDEDFSLRLMDDMLTAEGSTHYSELYPDV